MVLIEVGAVFGPMNNEHRHTSAPGIRYVPSENGRYEGNAIAGVVKPDSIELRNDPRLSDNKVRDLIDILSESKDLDCLKKYKSFMPG